MATFNSVSLSEGLKRIAAAAEVFAPELNAADGSLGDGDLGITVSKGFSEAGHAPLPSDVGLGFLECAKAFQRASSSSYGTLVATAFMSAAKACRGREDVPYADVPDLLKSALEAMMARGKGKLGDKTVLDSLAAIEAALRGAGDDPLEAAVRAARDTVQDFQGKANRLGRARSYGDKSVGLADPGQLALLRIVEGLKAR